MVHPRMDRLATKLERTVATLRQATRGGQVSLASSLSAEDMVITHLIATHSLDIGIFAIDTGMLHAETLGMIGKVRARYGLYIQIFRPNPIATQNYVNTNGTHAFYESLDLRHSCCGIRKVEPLQRALSELTGWVTGQRREQGTTRGKLDLVETDPERGVEKYNPLADWTWDEVLAFASEHDVPLNPLHAKGYPSIGCEPCTRAIRDGEDPRAGRWWWEQSDTKECGLHVKELVS
jgi:phosphoadenosine phosphosulfate reductase